MAEIEFTPAPGTGGGGVSYGAPFDASYVVMGLDGDLDAERVLTAGTGIDLSDGGANGNATISVDPSEVDHNALTGIDESGEDFHHLTWSQYGTLTDGSNADALHIHDHNALEGIDESGEDFHHLTWSEYGTLTDGSNADALHVHDHNALEGIDESGEDFHHLTWAQYGTLTDGSDADALHMHSAVGSHTITSHSDVVDATGAQLEELTGGGDTTLHDHDGIDENTASRHDELHSIASHNDTTATGAELETLTDGSNADALHSHSVVASHTIASHSDTTATGAELETLTDGSDADALHTHDYAPSDAQYLVKTADGDLSNEWVIYPVLPMTYDDTTLPGTYFVGFSITTLTGVGGSYTPDKADTLCINDVSAVSQPANFKITVAQLRKPLVETYTDVAISSGTVDPDVDTDGFKYTVDVDQACTVNVPSNIAEGMMVEFRFVQDTGGTNTVSWHPDYDFGDITATVGEGANEVTYVLAKYNEMTDGMDVMAVNTGYTGT